MVSASSRSSTCRCYDNVRRYDSESPSPQIPGETKESGQGLHHQGCHLSWASPESSYPVRHTQAHTRAQMHTHTVYTCHVPHATCANAKFQHPVLTSGRAPTLQGTHQVNTGEYAHRDWPLLGACPTSAEATWITPHLQKMLDFWRWGRSLPRRPKGLLVLWNHL